MAGETAVARGAALFDLTGKVAIVTGGNGGLGLGIGEALVGAGAALVIAARNRAKSEEAVERIKALGGKVLFVETDVADRASCEAMATAAVEAFGRIDILVANAGLADPAPASTMSEDKWRHTIDINLGGSLYSAQAVYPHMKAAGGGKIVMLGSMTSIFGSPEAVNYAASKGGVIQLAKSLAIGWARHNIQVNSILPGWFSTDIIAKTRIAHPEFDRRIVNRTPARRWGEPADLGGTAVFLCSPASDFVTGVSIPVDGGYSVN